jgi:hypothetical protein
MPSLIPFFLLVSALSSSCTRLGSTSTTLNILDAFSYRNSILLNTNWGVYQASLLNSTSQLITWSAPLLNYSTACIDKIVFPHQQIDRKVLTAVCSVAAVLIDRVQSRIWIKPSEFGNVVELVVKKIIYRKTSEDDDNWKTHDQTFFKTIEGFKFKSCV